MMNTLDILQRGEKLYADGNVLEAMKCFMTIVEHAEHKAMHCQAYNNLGVVVHGMNELKRAEEMFRAAFSLDSANIDVSINLADLYIAQKRYAEAEQILHCSSLANPGNMQLSNKLTLCRDKNRSYARVMFEISGICNAKCKYCVNGGENSLSGPTHRQKGKNIDVNDFDKAIRYMESNGIIDNSSLICLYNWGEPFLHPKIKEILSMLNDKGLSYELSTNASRPVFFNNDVSLSGLKDIVFSMPGFSQQSYDKIHGFNFERIKNNITKIITVIP